MNDSTKTYPKVVVKKVIRAKRQAVFDAWTKAELMEKWFVRDLCTSKVKIDLRVGGTYSNDMTTDGTASLCGQKDTGTPGVPQTKRLTGEYIEIDPPAKLVFSWSNPDVQNTRVTVQLRELDDSTEVTITHELLPTEALRKGHSEGWEFCLNNLSTFLS